MPNSLHDTPYSGSNSISGSIIVDTGSGAIDTSADYSISFFSLSDGVTTYSGPPSTSTNATNGTVRLDASSDIVTANLAVYNGFPFVPFERLFISASGSTTLTTDGTVVTYYDGGGTFLADGSRFEALSEAPGTWSGPTKINKFNGIVKALAKVLEINSNVLSDLF